MSKSTTVFQRWKSREQSTWPFQVFKKYGLELERLTTVHLTSHAFVYKQLKQTGANWTDDVRKHFTFTSQDQADNFANLKAWSASFNQFDNWSNLNAVIALSSNLETYMASVISLALDSDPGVLLGISQRLDGVEILKYGNAQINHEPQIVSCTKGDWQSRASAFKDIFGTAPIAITNNLGELEQIRQLRNKVGHAFGRDIEEARKNGVKEILPMESLKLHATVKYGKLLWSVAKGIDVQLLGTHIGEYQALQFYHRILPSFPNNLPVALRPFAFKKQIGTFKAQLPGKLLCKQLVKYYDEL